MRLLLKQVAGVMAGALLAIPAAADTLTLGQQDFEDGILTFHADYQAAQTGEAQGDGTINTQFQGNDLNAGSVLDTTFVFQLGLGPTPVGEGPAPSGEIRGATLTIGLFDHDSAADGDQLESFTMNGTPLTSVLSALMEASGGTQTVEGSEYNVYTIDLPTFSLDDLLSGLAFNIRLAPPSLVVASGFPPTGAGNGGGLDFARLVYSVSVPEPGAFALLGLGLASLLAARRRRA